MTGAVALLALEILKPLIVAGVSWFTVQASLWMANKTKNDKISALTARLFEVIRMVVMELMQTMVDQVKTKGEGERLGQADAEAIKTKALALVRTRFGDAALAELATGLKMDPQALQGLISSGIEATVFAIKTPDTTPTLPPFYPAPTLPPFLAGNPR